jgi:predicted anti-sigma-YlaC factor YlaD
MTARASVSALLDGEPPEVSTADLDAHLDGCAACRSWKATAHELTRRTRLAPASARAQPSQEAMDRIMTAMPRPLSRRLDGLRAALGVVALAEVLVALPLLLFAARDVQRDTGAVDMALVVAFALVAWKPSRAAAIAPVVGTAALLLVLAALIDIAGDKTSVFGESPHAVTFVGWLLVWQIARLMPSNSDTQGLPLPARWHHALASGGAAAPERPIAPDAYAEPVVDPAPVSEPAFSEPPARRTASG